MTALPSPTHPKPPRGIQLVKRRLQDGSFSYKFRVQFSRAGFDVDKVFETEQQAIEFLTIQKALAHKKKQEKFLDKFAESIPDSVEEKSSGTLVFNKDNSRLFAELMHQSTTTGTFESYAKLYVERMASLKYPDMTLESIKTPEGKMQHRNYKNTLSCYRIICRTVIDHYTNLNAKFDDVMPIYDTINKKRVSFGSLSPFEISKYDINSYIESRLKKGIKASSIEREITHISNVYNNLRHIDFRFDKTKNPTIGYDKNLLKLRKEPQKVFNRISDEDMTKLLEVLENYKNEEMSQIVLLMLHTSLRRIELLLLEWSNIQDNFFVITKTKNRKLRYVYINEEAQAILATVKKKPNQNRLFSYTVLGWQGSFDKLMKENGLSHLKAHGFRKEAISTMIEKIGAENSMLVAKMLGVANTQKLEKRIDSGFYGNMQKGAAVNQKQALKTFAHSNPNITMQHYFELKRNSK